MNKGNFLLHRYFIPQFKVNWVIVLTFLFLILNIGQIRAQEIYKPKYFNDIIPPAPTSTSLGKYGNIPVGYHTGTPNISIPLYEIKGRELTLPISLSYHASGLRVEEIPSWVGAGWSLNAGGVITRTVHGRPDENKFHPKGYLNSDPVPDSPTNATEFHDYFCSVAIQQINDAQPDMFNFNVNGISGEFFFDQNGKAHTIPYQNIRIAKIPLNGGFSFAGFQITGPDGIKYDFGHLDRNGTLAVEITNTYNTCDESAQVDAPTAYYLTQMTHPNGEKIYFEYTPHEVRYDMVASETAYFGIGSDNPPTTGVCQPINTNDICYNPTVSNTVKLSKVVGEYFSANFVPNIEEREDLEGGISLKTIEINNNATGEILQSFNFTHDYSIGNRLILQSVHPDCSPAYNFEYYSGLGFPSTLSKARDHWGFSNGANNNYSLIPKIKHAGEYIGTANREPSFRFAVTGTLKKIQYPTGGWTTFQYEQNNYGNFSPITTEDIESDYWASVRPDSNTDGQLIEDITNFTVTGNDGIGIFTATFEVNNTINDPQVIYAKIEKKVGTSYQQLDILFPPSGTNNIVTVELDLDPGEYRIIAAATYITSSTRIDAIVSEEITVDVPITSKPVGGIRIKKMTDVADASATPVIQEFEYKIEKQGLIHSSGHIYTSPKYLGSIRREIFPIPLTDITNYDYCDYQTFVSTSNSPLFYQSGNPVGYEQVKVKYSDGGSTIYSFTTAQDAGSASPPFAPFRNKNWKKGLLLEKKEEGNGTTRIEQNIYRFIEDGTYGSTNGLAVVMAWKHNNAGDCGNINEFNLHHYEFSPYKRISPVVFLDQKIIIQDGVETITDFEYDELTLNQTAAEVTNSDGRVYKTETDYAIFNEFDCLRSYHIFNVPKESRKYVDGQIVGGTKIEFNSINGYCRPTSFTELLSDGSELLRATATYYNQSGLKGLLKSYQPNFHPLINQYEYFESGPKSALLKSRTLGDWEWNYDWDEKSRQISSIKDINDIESTFQYDDCQRLSTSTERNGALFSSYDYAYNQASGNGPNYVRKYNSANKLTTFQYFDGLGRPLQNVLQKYAPDHTDVVQSAVIYDGVGQPYLQYLPFTGGSDGSYVIPYGPKTTIDSEQSPQNREIKRTFADNTEINTIYSCNANTDIVINHHTGGIYPACSLNKVIVIDENGHKTETYTDKIGQLILTRKFVDGESRVDTYNNYDVRGNVIKILPPESTQYDYVYDNRNRLIQKSVPGAGSTFYEYNERDLITKQTDANDNESTYVYDNYGRLTNQFVNGGNAIINEYDTGSGATKGKLTKETVGILSGGTISGSLITNHKFDNLGREVATYQDNIKQGVDVTTQSFFGGTDYVQSMDKVHNGFIKLKERYKYDHSFRLKETWHKVNNEEWAMLSAFGYNHRDELVGKAIGGHNHGDIPQVLQSIGYGYNVRGWLNTINYLPLNGEEFTISGPCIDPSDSLTTTDGGPCAYEVDFNQLLNIRQAENLIIDCYDPCDGYVAPPIQSSPYCDYQIDFFLGDWDFIDSIFGNGSKIPLPGFPYAHEPSISPVSWPGFKEDLLIWLANNGYSAEDIYWTFDLPTKSGTFIIEHTNFAFENLYASEHTHHQESVPEVYSYVFNASNCEANAGTKPRVENDLCSYRLDRYPESFVQSVAALGYEIPLPNYPYAPSNLQGSLNGNYFIYENLAEDLYAWLLNNGYQIGSIYYNIDDNNRELIISETNFPFYSTTFTDDPNSEVPNTTEINFLPYGQCITGEPVVPICNQLVEQNALNFIPSQAFANRNSNPYANLMDIHPGWNEVFEDDGKNWEVDQAGTCAIWPCPAAEAAIEVGYIFPLGANPMIYDYSVFIEVAEVTGEGFINVGLIVDGEFLTLTSNEQLVTITQAGLFELRPQGIISKAQAENMQVAISTISKEGESSHTTTSIDVVQANFKYRFECNSCPPNEVECSVGEMLAQEESLSAVFAAMNDYSLDSKDPNVDTSFPISLFRVTLCNGAVYYLMQHEIDLLAGNYSIDQEFIITSPDQIITIGSGSSTNSSGGGSGGGGGGSGIDPGYDNINIPDLFGMELHYYDKNDLLDAPSQYNGNISWMKWQVKGHYANYYGFQYDELDRLKRATFGEDSQGGFVKSQRYSVFSHTDDQIQYDKRGNILELVRGGGFGNCDGGGLSFAEVDVLDYTYAKGNQLSLLTDENALAGGVKFAQSNYEYDPNGNLTKDTGKKIFDAEYNHLNLPDQITTDLGDLSWTYDTHGNKLSKKVNTTTVKEYLPSGVEYNDVRIEAIYTSEGRIIPIYNSEIPELIDSFRYEYVLRDHLGNGRVYFSDFNEDSKITIGGFESEILQENHYYPFGLNMEGNWYAQQPVENGYQYNGKELNEEFGLNWNDYGARWYDAAIGRWISVDPLAEAASSWSPYRYGFDNPILYFDPDGLFEDKGKAKEYAKQNGIKTGGLFRRNKIKKQSNGTYGIENKKSNTVTEDLGGDLGVQTSGIVRANDAISSAIVQEGGFLNPQLTTVTTFRDGSTSEVGVTTGTAPLPNRVPKGEVYWNVGKQIFQKGGTFLSKTGKYIRKKLIRGKRKRPKTNTSRGSGKDPLKQAEDNYRELLENGAKKLKDAIDDWG